MKRDKCSLGNKQTCNKRSETEREGEGEESEEEGEGEERGLACDPVKLIIRIIGELNSPKERNPERERKRDGEMERATRGRQSVRERARQRHTSEQVATKRALFALRLIYHLDRFPPIKPAQRGLLLSLLLLFLCYRAARADYCLFVVVFAPLNFDSSSTTGCVLPS